MCVYVCVHNPHRIALTFEFTHSNAHNSTYFDTAPHLFHPSDASNSPTPTSPPQPPRTCTMPPTRRSTSSQSTRRPRSPSTSSTASIPFADPDPDPGPDHPLDLDHPKEAGLTLSSFVGNPPPAPTPRATGTGGDEPHWRLLAAHLLAARNSFAALNPAVDNPRCSAPDRFAVLDVYNQALARVEHMSDLDASRLDKEVANKVETILDLRDAKAGDPVFNPNGGFLRPLQPQYAKPRLDYCDRGKGSDGYGRAAWMRLREWRRDEWPKKALNEAVERDREERERRERQGKTGNEDLEGMERVVAWEGEWGEEVDAHPERPWR